MAASADPILCGAGSTNFTDTGLLQTCTVQPTGTYDIVAIGAQGGYGGDVGGTGGYGARLEGEVGLTAGHVLDLVVGTPGGNGSLSDTNDRGGGSGTFVIDTNADDGHNPTLLAAGGGGDIHTCSEISGGNVDIQHWGATSGEAGGSGGIRGNGGSSGNYSGGGGGIYTAGGTGTTSGSTIGGGGSPAGAAGYYFGGGSGAGASAFYDYLYGSKGHYPIAVNSSGGGGFVSITELGGLGASAPVPEPASLALFGTGLAGFGLIRRRRRG